MQDLGVETNLKRCSRLFKQFAGGTASHTSVSPQICCQGFSAEMLTSKNKVAKGIPSSDGANYSIVNAL
jgi:hypothetical protein